jgi:hypothetical protein
LWICFLSVRSTHAFLALCRSSTFDSLALSIQHICLLLQPFMQSIGPHVVEMPQLSPSLKPSREIPHCFCSSHPQASPPLVPNVSQTPSLSPTCTSLPLQKLPSMQHTPLTNTLTNLSSLVIPIRAYMHGIPVCCCADLASRNTQVLVFLDAAAEEVCGDSCATHCEVCGVGVWF